MILLTSLLAKSSTRFHNTASIKSKNVRALTVRNSIKLLFLSGALACTYPVLTLLILSYPLAQGDTNILKVSSN